MKYTLLVVLIVLVLIMGARLFFFTQQKPFEDKEEIHLTTLLLTEPRVQGRFQKFTFRESGQKIFVTTYAYPTYTYGDRLSINGKVSVREIESNTHIITMFAPGIMLDERPQFFPVQWATYVRSNIVRLYEKSLTQTGASLLSGIVLGVKTNMPKELTEDLRFVGLMHVVAASGMNVTMVAGALLFITSYFFHRRLAIGVSLFGILFYALISGFEASILRASLMAIVASVASIYGRQNIGILSLMLTAYIMILYDPGMIYDIGFLLSVSSTTGIILIKPKLDTMLSFIRIGRIIGDDFSTTLAAQMATLPILLSVFGQYGLLSIPVNFLVLWTVPFLMIIGGIGGIVGLVIPILGKIILSLAVPLLLYIEYVVRFAGSSKGSISVTSIPLVFSLGYYCSLLAFVLIKRPKRA